MLLFDTPYRAARMRDDSWLERMARACASVSFAALFFSPVNRGLLYPRPYRRRSTLSRMLSKASPVLRCAGLQHRGTSHECRTNSPGGIGPRESSYAIRWAPTCRPLLFPVGRQNMPYFAPEPRYSQHSSGPERSTNFQNLSAIGFGFLGILIPIIPLIVCVNYTVMV